MKNLEFDSKLVFVNQLLHDFVGFDNYFANYATPNDLKKYPEWKKGNVVVTHADNLFLPDDCPVQVFIRRDIADSESILYLLDGIRIIVEKQLMGEKNPQENSKEPEDNEF